MNKIYEFDYKGTHYVIKVNNKVRIALSNLQKKKMKLEISPECLEKLSKLDFEKIQHSGELSEEMLGILPYINEFQDLEMDPFDVVKEILVTLYNITEDTFESIVEELDEKLGTENLCEVVGNINKQAFTLVEKMNKALHQE